MSDEPCTIEDLRAIVPRWDSWSVDRDGMTVDMACDGCADHGHSDIDEYYCSNCGEYFTPEKHFDDDELARVWRRALDHLPRVTTSDRRIERVEVES